MLGLLFRNSNGCLKGLNKKQSFSLDLRGLSRGVYLRRLENISDFNDDSKVYASYFQKFELKTNDHHSERLIRASLTHN